MNDTTLKSSIIYFFHTMIIMFFNLYKRYKIFYNLGYSLNFTVKTFDALCFVIL